MMPRVLLLVIFAILVGPAVHGHGPTAAAEDGTSVALPGSLVASMDEALKQPFFRGDRIFLETLYALDAILVSPFGIFQGIEEISRYIERVFASNPGLHVTFGETDLILNTAAHCAFVTSDPIQQAGQSASS